MKRVAVVGRFPILLVCAVMPVGGWACQDSVGPTVESVAGAYESAALTVLEGVTSHDAMALNGGAGITLYSNGSTTGAMLLPPPTIDSVAHNAALTGTWALRDSLIVFTPAEAGELVSTTTFRLRGDGSFAGAFERPERRIAIRFVRQGNCRTRQC